MDIYENLKTKVSGLNGVIKSFYTKPDFIEWADIISAINDVEEEYENLSNEGKENLSMVYKTYLTIVLRQAFSTLNILVKEHSSEDDENQLYNLEELTVENMFLK